MSEVKKTDEVQYSGPELVGALSLPPVQVRLSRPLSQCHYVTQRARFESGVITTAVANVRAPADSPFIRSAFIILQYAIPVHIACPVQYI